MKKPKVIYHNNNKSNHNLVLHRLFFKKKDILGLYSYKLRVFLKALLSRRCSNRNNYIKNARNLRVAGIASSFLLVLLSAAIIIPIYNRTNNAEATTGTSKQSDTELGITTSSNIAGVDLLVKDNNGTFASSDDSGNTLGFNVTTNNYTGYTLTIASPDTTTYNNGKLTNADTTNCTDTNKCVLNTISSASNTISTNGTWGYKPSKLNSVANTNYLPSPTTTPTILDETDSPNTTPNPYTISIGAKADYTQPAGVYSNTYTLQATGNIVVIYMQDVTKEDMQALLPDVGDTMTLYDKRDNQAYTVGKLADGNHWLLENLALDLTDPSVQANLSSSTTNATDTILGYLKNGGGSSPYPASGVSSAWTGSGQNYYNRPYMVKNGNCSSVSYCTGGDNLTWDSTDMTNTGYYQGKIGVYYNYCAASAGSYCYGQFLNSGSAQYDICPSGWRLPTSGSDGEYQTLYDAYSGSSNQALAFQTALRTPISGEFSAGKAYRQNLYGYFWASTEISDSSAYFLRVGADNVEPTNSQYRYFGSSIRCIKREPYSLTINFAGSGVSSVQIRTASGTDGELIGTVSSSGGTVSNLEKGFTYYLYPVFSNDYELSSWSNTGTYGTLSSTSSTNPTFTIGAGDGVVTITGKSSKLYMQDLDLASCQKNVTNNIGDEITVYDRRDESDYTVRYINGACWMTQNLRITGTISSTDSNFNNVSSWNVIAADLKGSSYSYTQAQSHMADDTDASASSSATGGPYTIKQLGAWYNFCAASANNSNGCNNSGSYTPGTGTVTGDICPAGWRLPTYNTAPGAFGGITSSISPIYGGIYNNGSLLAATTYGYWWSSTAYSARSQHYLYYYSGNLSTGRDNKNYGLFVRCVRTS